MTKIALPHDALILIGDGRKALLLRNQGDEKFANLITERVLENLEAQNDGQERAGGDRPGRVFPAAHASARSAVEAHDPHQAEAHRFAARAAHELEQVFRARPTKAVVIAAPARTLADLRHALADDVKAHILVEIDKDLTKMPVWEIEKHLAA